MFQQSLWFLQRFQKSSSTVFDVTRNERNVFLVVFATKISLLHLVDVSMLLYSWAVIFYFLLNSNYTYFLYILLKLELYFCYNIFLLYLWSLAITWVMGFKEDWSGSRRTIIIRIHHYIFFHFPAKIGSNFHSVMLLLLDFPSSYVVQGFFLYHRTWWKFLLSNNKYCYVYVCPKKQPHNVMLYFRLCFIYIFLCSSFFLDSICHKIAFNFC